METRLGSGLGCCSGVCLFFFHTCRGEVVSFSFSSTAVELQEPRELLQMPFKKKKTERKKKGCATHTAGMSCMQSIESVSSGRCGGGEQ